MILVGCSTNSIGACLIGWAYYGLHSNIAARKALRAVGCIPQGMHRVLCQMLQLILFWNAFAQAMPPLRLYSNINVQLNYS